MTLPKKSTRLLALLVKGDLQVRYHDELQCCDLATKEGMRQSSFYAD